MPRGRRIDVGWLRERYPTMTDVNRLLDDYEAEFGWRPAKTVIYNKANRLGIRKNPVAGRGERAERTVYWSKEPEMEAWMLEHDRGQRTDEISDAFRGRFGFGLSRGQVNLFRASHGTQVRPSHRGGRPRRPVGTERVGKDGYVVVKVREEAVVPMSKDNWMLKHVWCYEQANGPVPEGHVVYFADGDRRNFDADNLVAVPRRLVGVMNGLKADGCGWHDAETLRAVMALAELRVARNDVIASVERTCRSAGRGSTTSPAGTAAASARGCAPSAERPGRSRRTGRGAPTTTTRSAGCTTWDTRTSRSPRWSGARHRRSATR